MVRFLCWGHVHHIFENTTFERFEIIDKVSFLRWQEAKLKSVVEE
jgi:hypothetical protein